MKRFLVSANFYHQAATLGEDLGDKLEKTEKESVGVCQVIVEWDCDLTLTM